MSDAPRSGERQPATLIRSCSQASEGSQIDSLQPEYDVPALSEFPRWQRPSVMAEIRANSFSHRQGQQPQGSGTTALTSKRRSMEARIGPPTLTLDALPVADAVKHKSPPAALPSTHSPSGRMVRMVGRTTAHSDSVDVVAVPGRINMQNAAPGTHGRAAHNGGAGAGSAGPRMVRSGAPLSPQSFDSIAYDKPATIMRKFHPTAK